MIWNSRHDFSLGVAYLANQILLVCSADERFQLDGALNVQLKLELSATELDRILKYPTSAKNIHRIKGLL
jgi:hypothetical protein